MLFQFLPYWIWCTLPDVLLANNLPFHTQLSTTRGSSFTFLWRVRISGQRSSANPIPVHSRFFLIFIISHLLSRDRNLTTMGRFFLSVSPPRRWHTSMSQRCKSTLGLSIIRDLTTLLQCSWSLPVASGTPWTMILAHLVYWAVITFETWTWLILSIAACLSDHSLSIFSLSDLFWTGTCRVWTSPYRSSISLS